MDNKKKQNFEDQSLNKIKQKLYPLLNQLLNWKLKRKTYIIIHSICGVGFMISIVSFITMNYQTYKNNGFSTEFWEVFGVTVFTIICIMILCIRAFKTAKTLKK